MQSPFHAREVDTSTQRPASDVFRSSATEQENGIKSRFASAGKFTKDELDDGADIGANASNMGQGRTSTEEDQEPFFDPDDKRSLYERLQAHKDAKQEEWDHAHTFKNQMGHWRLDEDDVSLAIRGLRLARTGTAHRKTCPHARR